jgi:hypothetical protein
MVALAVGGVLAIAGCGIPGGQPSGGPAARSAEEARADIERYADQTAVLVRSSLTNATTTETPCGGGLFRVENVYRIPLWITLHPKARAALRNTWVANKLPITRDSTSDGYLGAISTVTPDGYTIEVVSVTPRPTALTLQVRSRCLRLR